jgi:hypothetical protein
MCPTLVPPLRFREWWRKEVILSTDEEIPTTLTESNKESYSYDGQPDPRDRRSIPIWNRQSPFGGLAEIG